MSDPFDMAFKGDLPSLRTYLQSNKYPLQHKDRKTTLLYTAARNGNLPMVKCLVEEFNADVNLANTNDSKSTPLHGAAFGAAPEVVKYLISKGANIVKNGYKESPLDNANEPADGTSPTGAAECQKFLKMCEQGVPALTKEAKALGWDVAPKTAKAELIIMLAKGQAPPPPPPPPPAPAQEEAKAPEDDKPAKKAKKSAKDTPSAPPPPPPVPPAQEEEAADEPKAKKTKSTTKTTPAPAKGGGSGDFSEEYLDMLRNATVTLSDVEKDTEAFWDLEEKVNSCCQGRNDDYVKDRLKKKKKPITFILKSAQKISNPVLEKLFNETRDKIIAARGDAAGRIRVAFHGSNPKNIMSIIKTSLLRFGHPLNPCKEQADDGYFGTNKKGVYVSRYYDYTLKYSNNLTPLDVGQTAKVIMFKALPGNNFRVEKLNMGMDPTPGYDSHSSPSFLEWYMFNEHQLCPEYVIEIQAKEDSRTAADDE